MAEESTRLIDVPYRELDPMIRKLSQNGFDAELAAELRTDEGAALAMKVLKQHFRPTEELFKRPYGIGASFSGKRDQVRQLQAWQEEFGWWGFGPEEFENALKEKPGEWMKQYGRLVMPVFVTYLDDWWAMLNALWSLVGRQHAYDVCAGLAFPRGTLQLTEPDKYPGHGLRWELIDLGSGLGSGAESSMTVDTDRPAFLAVMAAAALNPLWVHTLMYAPRQKPKPEAASNLPDMLQFSLLQTDHSHPGVYLSGLQTSDGAVPVLFGSSSPRKLYCTVRNGDPNRKLSVPTLYKYD